jgi:Flp pilus assembly protein TadG
VASAIRGDDDGQALVEFALALPLLVLFLFGIIYFAEALNYWNTETNAVNVAARYTAVIGNQSTTPSCGSSSNVTDYAVCKAKSGAGALAGSCAKIQDLTSNPSGSGSNTFASGDQVQITMKYNDAIPVIGPLFGPINIAITSSATMMMEGTPTGSQLTWASGATSFSC